MSHFVVAPVARPVPIPVSAILPWLAFATAVGFVMIYFIGAEQGATSLISGHAVHEFVHDGRHVLGFPCH